MLWNEISPDGECKVVGGRDGSGGIAVEDMANPVNPLTVFAAIPRFFTCHTLLWGWLYLSTTVALAGGHLL